MSVLPQGSESMKHERIGLLHARNALHNQTPYGSNEGRKERERCILAQKRWEYASFMGWMRLYLHFR